MSWRGSFLSLHGTPQLEPLLPFQLLAVILSHRWALHPSPTHLPLQILRNNPRQTLPFPRVNPTRYPPSQFPLQVPSTEHHPISATLSHVRLIRLTSPWQRLPQTRRFRCLVFIYDIYIRITLSTDYIAYIYMHMYIFIHYKHICIPLSRIYIVYINFSLYYDHTCIPLSKDYIVYMYTHMYIFMYYNHICTPLFKGFI